MATPAEQSLERERIRQSGALLRQQDKASTFDLDTAITASLVFSAKQGGDAGDYLAIALKEKSRLEGLRSKLSADAFTKALGEVMTLSQKIAAGNGSQSDNLKFIAAMTKLRLDATAKMNAKDDGALARWTQAGSVAGVVGSPAHNREMVKQAIREYKDYGEYDPMLPGTVKVIKSMVGGVIPADLADDWAVVEGKAADRTDQLTDIGAFAKLLPPNIGSLNATGQAEAVKQFLANLPAGTLNEFAATAGKLPSSASLDAVITAKDVDAKAAKDAFEKYLQMDPLAVITAIKGDAAGTKAKDGERLRILSSEKFQKWAASNGLRVGSVRPATSEADKKLPGYIPSTNSVYVAGAEDDRALGIATKQATMKPSQMLIPRRGLETRKYVEATVGGEPKAGLTNFVKYAEDKQGRIVIRPDGSAVRDDGSSVDTPYLNTLEVRDIPADQVAKVNEAMVGVVETTGGGQKIRGVETALMWSDPPDAVMAIETPEGKRVIIRKQDEKNINVLSGGEERKNGVIRSLLAKARERIARPNEDKLRAADEAAMSEVDKAREAELETKRQAEQAANPNRMQPAAAKAAVEAAVAEQPTEIKTPEGTQTFGNVGSALGAARARQLIQRVQENPDLAMAPGVSDLLDKKISFVDRLEKVNPALYQEEIAKLGQEANRILLARTTGQVLSPGREMPAEDKARERAAYLASQPEVKVTPTSTAGKEVREASSVNMTGANAPQMLGVDTGTPTSAPAVPTQNDAQKRSAAALALRRKQQFEKEAQEMGANMMPNRLSADQRAGTTEADRLRQRSYTRSYQDWAAQQPE
jgi:hypothetical protein